MSTRSRMPKRQVFFALVAMALLASCCAAAVAGPWADERHYGPVICRGNLPLAPYDGLFRQLVDLQRELERTLAVPPPANRSKSICFARRPATPSI